MKLLLGLIVPLWNWNFHGILGMKFGSSGLIVPLWNWNWLKMWERTDRFRGLIVPLWNWNELLCGYNLRGILGGLIVPLWNWNLRGSRGYSISNGFNRTFMELKLFSRLTAATKFVRFNRTFMELKFVYYHLSRFCSLV